MEVTSPLALLAQESVAGPSTSLPESESQVEVITVPDDEPSTTSPNSTDTESVWPCVTGRVVKWPCGHVYNPKEITCVECMYLQWKSEFEAITNQIVLNE